MSDLQEIETRHKEDDFFGNRLSEYQTHLDRGWLLKRIAELEQAILKNVDISWEPWKSLFPQPGEQTDE